MADDEDLSIVDLIRQIRLFQLEEVCLFDRLIVALAAEDNPICPYKRNDAPFLIEIH